jgi:hypothetical protein
LDYEVCGQVSIERQIGICQAEILWKQSVVVFIFEDIPRTLVLGLIDYRELLFQRSKI